MDHTTSPPTRLVLTQWKGQPPEDTTWEPWSELRDSYHLEDKVVFGEGGIDMPMHNPAPEATNPSLGVTRTRRETTTPHHLHDYVLE